MSSGVVNESVYENAVIEVLKKAGWEYLYGPDIERADYRDPTMLRGPQAEPRYAG